MSYARFGWWESDVYIFATTIDGREVIECCGCHVNDGASITCDGPQEMLDHVRSLDGERVMDKCYRCSSKSTWWVTDDRGIPNQNITCCDAHPRPAVSRIFNLDKVTMSAVVRPYKGDDE